MVDMKAVAIDPVDLIGLPVPLEDEVLSPPVGRYEYDGLKIPFYASRMHTLNHPMMEKPRREFQVLVMTLGELLWINISPASIIKE